LKAAEDDLEELQQQADELREEKDQVASDRSKLEQELDQLRHALDQEADGRSRLDGAAKVPY